MEKNTTENIVTTIVGYGIIENKNDQATFTVTLKAKGDHLSDTKRQIKEKTASFLKELESKKFPLVGEITTSDSNYKMEHREGGEKYSAGFQSMNDITWTVAIDHTLNDLYEFCLKHDPNVSYLFTITNREVMLEQAIEKASTDLKTKLDNECKLLNLSSDKLKILKWNFAYGNEHPTNNVYTIGQGANGVTGVASNYGITSQLPGVYADRIVQKIGSVYQELLDHKLNPGTISVSASVTASYVWKE